MVIHKFSTWNTALMKNTKRIITIRKKKGFMKWLSYNSARVAMLREIRGSYELIFYVSILSFFHHHLNTFFQNYYFMQSSWD